MRTRAISLLAMALLLAILGIQNAGQVKVFFLFWSGSLSLGLVLLIIFAAGAAVGSLLARHPQKHQIKRGLVRDVDNE
jgi:uncharacterized integral membrane protein